MEIFYKNNENSFVEKQLTESPDSFERIQIKNNQLTAQTI
jgi:hypothetical protein